LPKLSTISQHVGGGVWLSKSAILVSWSAISASFEVIYASKSSTAAFHPPAASTTGLAESIPRKNAPATTISQMPSLFNDFIMTYFVLN